MNSARRKAGTALASAVFLLAAETAAAAELRWVGCDAWSLELAGELAEAFSKQTSVRIALEGGDSSRGIRDVASGLADIGCSDRHKLADQSERQATLITVAWDALVMIVHPANPVERISEGDLRAILAGKITQWSALGGPDKAIRLVVREQRDSGVSLLLREMLFQDPGFEFAASAARRPSASAVEGEVAADPYALAVTLFSRTGGGALKVLGLGSTAPGYETIASGKYPLALPLYVAVPKTRGDDLERLTAFLRGGGGQEIIKARGTVSEADGRDLFVRYQKLVAEARKKTPQ